MATSNESSNESGDELEQGLDMNLEEQQSPERKTREQVILVKLLVDLGLYLWEAQKMAEEFTSATALVDFMEMKMAGPRPRRHAHDYNESSWKVLCTVYGYLVNFTDPTQPKNFATNFDSDACGKFLLSIAPISDSVLEFYWQLGITERQCQWLLLVYKVHEISDLFNFQFVNLLDDGGLTLSGIPKLKQQQMAWAMMYLLPDPDPYLCMDGADGNKIPFNLKVLEYRAFRRFCKTVLKMTVDNENDMHEDMHRIYAEYGTYDYVQLRKLVMYDKHKTLPASDLMNIDTRHRLLLAFLFMEREMFGFAKLLDYGKCKTPREKNQYKRMERFSLTDFKLFLEDNNWAEVDDYDPMETIARQG